MSRGEVSRYNHPELAPERVHTNIKAGEMNKHVKGHLLSVHYAENVLVIAYAQITSCKSCRFTKTVDL